MLKQKETGVNSGGGFLADVKDRNLDTGSHQFWQMQLGPPAKLPFSFNFLAHTISFLSNQTKDAHKLQVNTF